MVRTINMDEDDVDYSDVRLLQIQMPYRFYDKYINDDDLFTFDMARDFFTGYCSNLLE